MRCRNPSLRANDCLKHLHFLPLSTVIRNPLNTTQFVFLPLIQFFCYSSSRFNSSETVTLHAKLIKNGSIKISQVSNHLLNLYLESQRLVDAQKLFDEIPDKDVRAWTILLSGYARIGYSSMALELFRKMLIDYVSANKFTLSCILKCCSSLNELKLGKSVHGWILRNGIDSDVVLENSILDLYVKCQSLIGAKMLFESMEDRDNFSWNIMVGGYLHTGEVERALDLFEELPDKDVASWNTVLDGLVKKGFKMVALELLSQMISDDYAFNKISFSIALNLVSSFYSLHLGREIHARVLRYGVHDDGFIRNSLIDMYCKGGEMEKALLVFGNISRDLARGRNSYISREAETISWSSIVSGYVRNGEYEIAIRTFISMVRKQMKVDKFTLTSIVSACADAGILELGRQIHACIEKAGHKFDAHMGSSLIDMYAKCGSLDDACMIFKLTDNTNVVLWTSMISGYGLHGEGKKAVWLFEDMTKNGISPNEVTFVGVLMACSHAGLPDEGIKYFNLMKELYKIKPGVEHFTCMVDLYGRGGRLKEAEEFIDKFGISHLSSVWRSLLSSCRLHKNIEMAKWVSEKLLQLEPLDMGPYILLSNIYASEHKWVEAENIRSLMITRGVKKNPGKSWIQLKDGVHTFVMGDRSHPRDLEIYSYLEQLIGRLKEIGYLSDLKMVMHDVEEEQGEVLLGFHSEKLAIAYGIISTACESPIRVMKNLRVCTDCHNFIKYTSQLLSREIIVRDIHRFHHFKNGQCSCGDYW